MGSARLDGTPSRRVHSAISDTDCSWRQCSWRSNGSFRFGHRIRSRCMFPRQRIVCIAGRRNVIPHIANTRFRCNPSCTRTRRWPNSLLCQSSEWRPRSACTQDIRSNQWHKSGRTRLRTLENMNICRPPPPRPFHCKWWHRNTGRRVLSKEHCSCRFRSRIDRRYTGSRCTPSR